MPYRIRKVEGDAKPFKIINTETGKEVGSSRTRGDAEASVRARLAAEHDKKR